MSRSLAGQIALIPWILLGVVAALGVAAVVLGLSGGADLLIITFGAAIGLVFAVTGALVASRLPRNPIGWIFCAFALLAGLGSLGDAYIPYEGGLPNRAWVAWAYEWFINAFTPALIALSFLLFPTGRLPSARWRPLMWTVLLVSVTHAASAALAPGALTEYPLENPAGIEAAGWLRTLAEISLIVLTAPLMLLCAASLFLRLRRASGTERQQIKWFAYAAALLVLFAVAEITTRTIMGERGRVIEAAIFLIFAVVISCIPVSMGIAILRFRLYDIDLIINRTLVYGALSVIVVALYVLVVGSLGALLQLQSSLFASLLATGLVAVIFAPLRDRLQRAVNRLMYGHRDDPYMVLSGLGARLETTLAPNAVLPTIVESVSQALKLPYAAITLKRNTEGESVKVAAYGKKSVGEPLIVPLSYQRERVGELILSPRSAGESFSDSDLKLLGDLAHQVGVAAHGVRLSADLQRSRERLVTAREEERKRLRRDLHDGVGPQLAALILKLETARNLLSHDPKTAALMAELSEGARATVSDVRRSVRALRPPALDELGLVAALREGAAHYSHNGLHISVEAPESLPPLPAAVEVATYHIAQEAMTNVIRHAGASKCSIRITLDEQADVVHLEVEDDGRGVGEDPKAGVGTHSMRERAEELGGRCTIEALPLGGTLVSVELPCWSARDSHRQEE
jgi:signal transduction histidine kinase